MLLITLCNLATNVLRQKGIMCNSMFLIADTQEKEQLMKIKIIEKHNCCTVRGFGDSNYLD